jgi:ATP-dependent RNA helicase RhlE
VWQILNQRVLSASLVFLHTTRKVLQLSLPCAGRLSKNNATVVAVSNPWMISKDGSDEALQDRNHLKQFSELELSPALQQRLASANFINPTPVQAAAIPPALEGQDILATAQTGTGKTLSFLIPLIERMPPAGKGASALVLLPTRELAMQVLECWVQLTQSKNSAVLVCGGLPEGPQLAAIRRGPRLIVATPGRLEDYLSRRLVNLDGVKMLVLDEVDRMLDMGFKPAIRRIAAALPSDRQTLCYSATLSPAIREVASDYMRNPVRIELGSVLKPSPNVELQSFEVAADKKQELLEHLLVENKGSFLVFVRTKHGADRVARRLSRAGHSATQIHGDRSQSQRTAALRNFAEGRHRVLVATDVAARGIDVADVAHVVNFDLPREAEDFVHRVGRTGRASSRGVASTFVAPDETQTLRRIERTLSITTRKYRVRAHTQAA